MQPDIAPIQQVAEIVLINRVAEVQTAKLAVSVLTDVRATIAAVGELPIRVMAISAVRRMEQVIAVTTNIII